MNHERWERHSQAFGLYVIFIPFFILLPLYKAVDLVNGTLHWDLSTAVFLLCGIVCTVLSFWLPNSATRPGILSAIVLFALIVVGIWGSSSGLSKLLPFFDASFVSNGRERWEVVALISTAFMAGIYFDALDDIEHAFIKHGKKYGVKPIRYALLAAIGLVIAALVYLHDIGAHYFCILGVAVLFSAIDFWIFWRLRDSTDSTVKKTATESGRLLLALDLPVLLGFIIMGGYYITLGCQPSVLATIVTQGITYEQVIAHSCVEVYPFLAGTLAFQMISFNIIYVFFTFQLHESVGQPQQPIPSA